MPLWLELLRTPMAAPETSDLRRMRRTWQALCILLALVVGGFGPLRQWVGRPTVAAVALALLVGGLGGLGGRGHADRWQPWRR